MGGLVDVSTTNGSTTRRADDANGNHDDDDVRMTTTTTRGKRTPTTRTVLKKDALMDDDEYEYDGSEYSTRTSTRRERMESRGRRRASEDYVDRSKGGANTTTNANTTNATRGNDRYECNVCFDTAQDPVVTRCGHLYCWACIHRWLEGARVRGAQSTAAACPVCKAEVTEDALIPLYGHGEDGGGDDRRGALRFRGKMRSAHHRRSGSDVLAALEPASRGLAALLGLRVGDDLTLAQANQLLLSRVLLTIGTLVVIALLVI